MIKTPDNKETILCHRCGYIVTKTQIKSKMISILKEEIQRLKDELVNWQKEVNKLVEEKKSVSWFLFKREFKRSKNKNGKEFSEVKE